MSAKEKWVSLYVVMVYLFGAGATSRIAPRATPLVCDGGIRGMSVVECVREEARKTGKYVFGVVLWPATLLFMAGRESVEDSAS